LWYRLYSPSVSDQSAPFFTFCNFALASRAIPATDRIVFLNEEGELSGPGSMSNAFFDGLGMPKPDIDRIVEWLVGLAL